MLLLALALFAIGQNFYVNAASTERNGVPDNKFADDDKKSINYDIVVPEACKDLDYCMIKPDDSPQDEINNFLGNGEMSLHESAQIDDSILRRKRMLNDHEFMPLCDSVIKYEKMFAVKNNNKWYEVLPNNDDYVVSFYHEECLNPGAPCNVNEEPNAFQTIPTCKQEMMTVQVQAITSKGVKENVNIKLPSGCSCEIKPYSFTP